MAEADQIYVNSRKVRTTCGGKDHSLQKHVMGAYTIESVLLSRDGLASQKLIPTKDRCYVRYRICLDGSKRKSETGFYMWADSARQEGHYVSGAAEVDGGAGAVVEVPAAAAAGLDYLTAYVQPSCSQTSDS